MNREDIEKKINGRIGPVRERATKLAHLDKQVAARRMSCEFDVCVYVSKGTIFASFVDGESKEVIRRVW